MKHIIIGNGANINFDNNPKRWKEFIVDCQVNFLMLLNNAKESKNHQINSIYKVWNIIKKYIDLDKESKSLENITKYFNFWNYKEYLKTQEEYILFLEEVWCLTCIPFLNKEDFPVEVPNFLTNARAQFQLNTHLDTISKMYKKAIEITLFQDYKINEIQVPKEVINYINNNYETKISINYDGNLDNLDELVKLHGSYLNNLIYYDDLKREVPMEYLEFVNFVKENTLQWDMVLNKESKIKSRQLETLDNWKNYGLAPTLRHFGVANKYIDTSKVKVANVITYDILVNLKGEVHIIGVSPYNDQQLFDLLLNNPKITKIIFYSDDNFFIKKDKIINKHFKYFWNMINIS